jgi:hypothetical protein
LRLISGRSAALTLKAIPLMHQRAGLSADAAFFRTFAFYRLEIVFLISDLAADLAFAAIPLMT